MDKFSTVRDTEGRYIATLDPAELVALSNRCARYTTACAERGLTPEPARAMLCAAVEYYQTDSARGAVAMAFARFSELRRECSALGYVVPPIHGTPHAAEIRGICQLLVAAISAAVPLPDEDPTITRRITDSYKADIKAAMAILNAQVINNQERPFANLFDDAPEIPF